LDYLQATRLEPFLYADTILQISLFKYVRSKTSFKLTSKTNKVLVKKAQNYFSLASNIHKNA